jgi:iron complex transport system ATP-binding protein
MRITAEHVSLNLGGMPVLASVDLDLRSREIVGLIGPNGAGKTTLLRLLAGLQTPDEGRVRYDGKGLSEIGASDLARRVAYLAQGAQVQWSLRVDHLVALGRLPHRRPFRGENVADKLAIEAALIATETAQLRHRSFRTLSGGERMRALLARALAIEADMLLADEPIAALDPLHQLQAMDLLREIARQGTGVVVVLHDLTLAARYCDRLVLLAKGRAIADGPPSLLSDALIEAAYGITALRGEHQGESFILPWSIIPR